jgi:hypothetical protein
LGSAEDPKAESHDAEREIKWADIFAMIGL